MDFEEQKVPDSILDKYTKVCTCRSISRKTIKEAINDGCDKSENAPVRAQALAAVKTAVCALSNSYRTWENYQNRVQKKKINNQLHNLTGIV